MRDGYVMWPPAGWRSNARIEFVIQDATHVGGLPREGPVSKDFPEDLPVYRATFVGTFEGKEIIRNVVFTTPPEAKPHGDLWLTKPAGMKPPRP